LLILLSPAKTLDFSPAPAGLPSTKPRLEKDIALLVERCKELDTGELARLMKLSDKLAELNHRRFQEMSLPFTRENSKAALLAFQGDVYRRLDAASLTPDDLLWAQDHLRILSGLYGLLRPLDLIQPYRLEMGTRLVTQRGETLYAFWGHRLAEALSAEHAQRPVAAVLNLASNEYAKAVPPERLEPPMISAEFQEWRDGKLKTISFSAKKARGMMARFAVRQRIEEPAGLKEFAEEGYSYQPELSTDDRLLFARERPAG
jgi:cytoplasmic iron level regulating protein YaaA (DUF328/UPF0246 family)